MAEGDTLPQTIEEKIDHVCRLSERMLVKLFGEVEGEVPTGRLPMLEATQREHDLRLQALERVALKAAGAIGVLGLIVGLLEAAAHFASAVKH